MPAAVTGTAGGIGAAVVTGVAVVTGAAGGIGAAVAARLTGDGIAVAVADRDLDLAREVAAGLGPTAAAFRLDVRSWTSVDALAVDVGARLGPVELLVNGAGITRVAPSASLGRQD